MSLTLSQFVNHQPGATEYIRGQYPGVLEFIQAYWEWMEESGNVVERIGTLKDQRDIDKSLDEFVTYFHREFLRNIPKTIVADKRNLVKNIKDFYRARGSEKAYRLLFRILFDTEVDFYYPKEDVLRASDGKWTVDTVIRTTTDNDTLQFISREIIGQTSGARANVENVVQFQSGDLTVSEIYISSLEGEFSVGETVTCNDVDETVYGLVTGATITDAGTAYRPDDLLFSTGSNTTAILSVNVTDGFEMGRVQSAVFANFPQPAAIKLSTTASDVADYYKNMFVEITEGPGVGQIKKITSYNAVTKVAILDSTWGDLPTINSRYRINIGRIKTIKVKDFGVGYPTNYPTLTVNCSLSGNGNATAELSIGAVGRYSGRYVNDDGFLSANKHLQDSFYYQDYSYVLKAEKVINDYRNVVKKLLHPAGLTLFGIVNVDGVKVARRTHAAHTVVTTSEFNGEIPELDLVAEYQMLEDLSDSQKLYDVSGLYPNGNNAVLGSWGVADLGDPTWSSEGIVFQNNYVSGLWTPIDNHEQTVVVVAKPSTLTGSPIGSIDLDDESQTSGYRITVGADGKLTFTTQKYTTTLNTLSCSTDAGKITVGDYFFATLRYLNNTLVGNLNKDSAIVTTFPTDVDAQTISQNSRGYFIGTGGYVNRAISSPLWGSALYGATLTGIPETITPGPGLQNGFFDGTVAYAIIYDRYLTDTEILDAYLTLKTLLAGRGITLN